MLLNKNNFYKKTNNKYNFFLQLQKVPNVLYL